MRKIIVSKIVKLLEKKGFQRKPSTADAKINLYNDMKNVFLPKNDEIVSLIFSKDRAMQLDAFLASYFENVTNYSEIVILYYVSSDAHRKSYEDLKEIYKHFPAKFVEETNFRNNLIETLNQKKQDRIIFYVDDMLFSQKIDYHWFQNINPLQDILSLSRGKDLKYSTVLAKKIEVPQFSQFSNQLYRFNWDEIKEFSDWTYPIGVSGYMFSRPEFLALIKATAFKAPNSLEANLQVFMPYFINRGGVCLENVATPCIHANLTQTEGYNNILGHYSLEELLVYWNQNKRINYREFLGLSVSIAEIKKYNFMNRI